MRRTTLLALIGLCSLHLPLPASAEARSPTVLTVSSNTVDTSDTARHLNSPASFRTRLLFTPTARPMKKGSVELSVTKLALPQVAVGITSALSIEAGVLLTPNLIGELFLLTPKVSLWSQGPLNVALDAQTMIRREKNRVAPKSKDLSSSSNRSHQFREELLWRIRSEPRVVGTFGRKNVSASLGIGVAINSVGFGGVEGRNLFQQQGTALRLTAGGTARLLDWLNVLSENHLYTGMTAEGAWVGTLSETSVDHRETIVQSINGVRLYSENIAADVGVILSDLPRFREDPDLSPYLRLSYGF